MSKDRDMRRLELVGFKNQATEPIEARVIQSSEAVDQIAKALLDRANTEVSKSSTGGYVDVLLTTEEQEVSWIELFATLMRLEGKFKLRTGLRVGNRAKFQRT